MRKAISRFAALPIPQLLGLALLLLLALLAVHFSPFNEDVGYQLSVAKKISRGLVPYRDFPSDYTPLVSYLVSPFFRLWAPRLPPYDLLMASVLLFGVLSAWSLGQLLKDSGISPRIRWLGIFLFFFYYFSYEGIYFILEPFVLFFALMALRFAWKAHEGKPAFRYCFLSGICVASSFLCKQYGLAAILPALYLVTARRRGGEGVARVLGLGAGFLSVTGIFLVYFCVWKGVNAASLFSQLFNHLDYAHPTWSSTLTDFFLFHCPQLALLPLVYLRASDSEKPLLIAFGLFSLSFGSTLFIQQFPHYFLLLAPSLVFFACALLEKGGAGGAEPYPQRAVVPLLFLVILSSLLPEGEGISLVGRSNQLEAARLISSRLPTRKDVFLALDPCFYYLVDFSPPPGLKRYGFTWLMSPEEIREAARQAQVVVTDGSEHTSRLKKAFGGESFETVFPKQGLVKTHDERGLFAIWSRSRLPAHFEYGLDHPLDLGVRKMR